MAKKKNKDVADHEWIKVTEDEIWKFVTKSITRTIYDVIATYEAHKSSFIPVAWLRDYADDIAVNFPRIIPSDIKRKT
jgi:hypothetical protein